MFGMLLLGLSCQSVSQSVCLSVCLSVCTELVKVVDGIMFGVLIPGLCLTGVSVSTLLTVLRLNKMAAWRGQSTSTSISTALTAKDVALTRMLIGISILYIICTTPSFVFHTTILFLPGQALFLSGHSLPSAGSLTAFCQASHCVLQSQSLLPGQPLSSIR